MEDIRYKWAQGLNASFNIEPTIELPQLKYKDYKLVERVFSLSTGHILIHRLFEIIEIFFLNFVWLLFKRSLFSSYHAIVLFEKPCLLHYSNLYSVYVNCCSLLGFILARSDCRTRSSFIR